MRKDLGFYVEADIQQVYQAYLNAATHKPFSRDCKQEPFHTIGFGVNYSMKYNMNGGSCTIHFMPYGSGTAVNIHFSLVQAAGGRCGKYAEDLNCAAQAFMPLPILSANYNADDFLRPENRVSANPTAPAAAPQAPAAPADTAAPAAPQAASAPTAFCTHCGTQITAGARFCAHCGTQVAVPTPKACPNCGAPAKDDARFCSACGTRL